MENELKNDQKEVTPEHSAELLEKVGMVMRQTDYTEEQARDKLLAMNSDVTLVLKDYFGVPAKKPEKPAASVNQQIYREIRKHLNTAMDEYQVRVEKGEAKRII